MTMIATMPDLASSLQQIRSLMDALTEYTDIATRVERINAVRELIAEYSPFQSEPVDFVRWVPADAVTANDYNPNQVAPPEMELLRLSVMADGYTQPIVTNREESSYVVVDGFHRNRVGK
jgi:hypothetical protein